MNNSKILFALVAIATLFPRVGYSGELEKMSIDARSFEKVADEVIASAKPQMALVGTQLSKSADASEWHGQYSGVIEPSIKAVTDTRHWESLWKSAFSAPAPNVDFDRHFAVAVFLGMRNTGGYDVKFLSPNKEGTGFLIHYRILSPRPGNCVPQVFTQPYGIKLYSSAFQPFEVQEIP